MFKCFPLSFIVLLSNLPAVFADPIGSILGGLLGGSGGGLGGFGGLGEAGAGAAGASGIEGAAGGLGSAGGAVGQVASNAESFFGFAQNGLSLIGQGVKIANEIAQSPFFPPLLNSALDAQKLAQQQLYANNPLLGAYEPLDLKHKSTGSDFDPESVDGGSAESAGQEGFSGVDPRSGSSNPFKPPGRGSNAFRVPKFNPSDLLIPDASVGKGATGDDEFSDVAAPDPLALPPAFHPDPYSLLRGAGASDGDEPVSTPNPTDKPDESDYVDFVTAEKYEGEPSSTSEKDSDYLDSIFLEKSEGGSLTPEKEVEALIPLAKAAADPFSTLGGAASSHGQPSPQLPPMGTGVVPNHPQPFVMELPGFQDSFSGLPSSKSLSTNEESQNPQEHTGTPSNSSGITGNGGNLTETRGVANSNATLPTGAVGSESANSPTVRPSFNSAEATTDFFDFDLSATDSPTPDSGLLRTDEAPDPIVSATEAAVIGTSPLSVVSEPNQTVPPIATHAPLRRVIILPRSRLLRLNSVQTKRPVLTKIVDSDFRHK